VDRVWFLRAVKARAIAVARDRKQIPWLVTRLRTDVDLRVSEAAAGALATLDAIDDLKAALSIEEPARRRAAVAGIGEIPGAKARSLLIEATHDPSPGIVFEAAAALLGRGEVEAFPLLISLLNADAPVWLGALNELEKRTGLEFGRNPARWAEWYRSRKEHLRFDPKSGRFEGVG
jgi:HEAT repeat protein